MTVESTSGGNPEDDNGESRGFLAAGDHADLGGVGAPRVADDTLLPEAAPGDTGVTRNRITVGRCPESSVAIYIDKQLDLSEGVRCDAGSVRTCVPDPGDNSLKGNRIGTGLGRLVARRPRVPKVLDIHRRAAEVIIDSDHTEDGAAGGVRRDAAIAPA